MTRYEDITNTDGMTSDPLCSHCSDVTNLERRKSDSVLYINGIDDSSYDFDYDCGNPTCRKSIAIRQTRYSNLTSVLFNHVQEYHQIQRIIQQGGDNMS